MILNRFIVVEGIDGSGKSTVMPHVAKLLKKHGQKVQVSAEPTSGHIGTLIRDILHRKSRIAHDALPLLYAADRYYHLFYGKQGVVNYVQRHKCWAICSRYLYSSFAYQHTVADDAFIARLNQGCPLPQFLFYIDVDPDICIRRMHTRDTQDIFEHAKLLHRIHARYATIIEHARKSDTIVNIVDGDQPSSNIARTIMEHIVHYL